MRLTAQAKGAGMIQPRFATMLCFVQTDAALAPETADLLLGVCVKRSFDRITVDGQLSTNDTVVLQCSGASGVRGRARESEDELRFGQALDALLRQLALLIVRDGEGARRIGRVVVRGGNGGGVERARGRSPTRRSSRRRCTAATPTGARIAQAVGAALAGHRRRCAFDIAIEGIAGVSPAAPPSSTTRTRWQAAVAAATEVEYVIGLPGDGAEAEVFFSDLGHEYVTINAEYTT